MMSCRYRNSYCDFCTRYRHKAQPIRTSHFYYVWSGFASACLKKAKKGLEISKRYPEAECQRRSDNSIDKRQQQKNTKNITLKLDDISGAPECKLYSKTPNNNSNRYRMFHPINKTDHNQNGPLPKRTITKTDY